MPLRPIIALIPDRATCREATMINDRLINHGSRISLRSDHAAMRTPHVWLSHLAILPATPEDLLRAWQEVAVGFSPITATLTKIGVSTSGRIVWMAEFCHEFYALQRLVRATSGQVDQTHLTMSGIIVGALDPAKLPPFLSLTEPKTHVFRHRAIFERLVVAEVDDDGTIVKIPWMLYLNTHILT